MVHTMSKQDSRAERSRRVHSEAFKQDLIARSLVSGASVSAMALQAGVNANLLFKWRREHLRAQRASAASANAMPMLLPVTLAAPSPAAVAASARTDRSSGAGRIEIDIDGARVRVCGMVDEAALRSVLRALRERA